MKRKRFLLGMLVFTLVFGMTVVGCDNGDEEGKEEKINLPSTSGEFNFTGIPLKYNGKFVLLEGNFKDDPEKTMIGLKGATINTSYPNSFSSFTCVKIENGSVKIPLYTFPSSSPTSTIQAYSGSDEMFVYIYVYSTEVISEINFKYNRVATAVFGTVSGNTPTTFPVEFTDGSATKSNNEADKKLD